MIKTLLNPDLTPAQLITRIKTMNMGTEVKSLADQLLEATADTQDTSHRAAIMKVLNIHTGTLTLHCNKDGNISIKAPDNAPAPEQFYSVPGKSILFAINGESFPIQLYQLEDQCLTRAERVSVDGNNPLFVDGAKVLFDSNPDGNGHPAFIGSINLPERTADISVFDPDSLRKIAWFPHDDSAARFLASLELLEAAQDPGACKVAEELIYHYHPAVAWKAFQIISRTDLQAALNCAPLLRNLQNSRLNHLLDQCEAA
ncbi:MULTISPECIES: hypothetical protein [unclassified Pseudomonas]|uniref:hypothetical protein n=1 Tax=unclassified Pseudomonas TaxID=196821 RepID=UPI002A3651A6|nr:MULTISPECIES: hypothetical protein [unclassified Pseudomonas]MDX9669868.1 hypothetical protein [Pseudomonas sp. P8_250]WPN36109.1 hypothetical protein QMK53_00185 [Pseudomonas sp. P8_139]WPN42088.1 hypothetical protein QMK55_02685 [Pseudomonas sp. P8_229]